MTNNPEDEEREYQPKDSQEQTYEEGGVCIFIPPHSLRAGMVCPRCHAATIDYDGMLNLVCPNCGLTEAGACT